MSRNPDPSWRELEPWAKGASEDALDQQLGAILRSVPEPEALSEVELARVQRRLRAQRTTAVRRPRVWREATLTLLALLGGGTVAVAGWGTKLWLEELAPEPASVVSQAAPGASVPSERVSKRKPRVPSGASVPALGISQAPMDAPAPLGVVDASASTAGARNAQVSGLSPRAGEAEARGALRQGGLAEEAAALERSLVELHRNRNAAGALALLDEYRQQFPAGELASEAAVARVDALVLLGRKAEALAVLTRLPMNHVGRGSELKLLRAELLADGDCVRALLDFDALLAGALSQPLAERALHGRAGCRLRIGDVDGARGDLQTYLVRYPEGRFAASARARLKRP